jgi:HAD superfamily hydrolase (TIGR01509 family)
MTKPRLLLFDLGNVLVRFIPDRFSEVLGLDMRDVRNTYEGPVRELTNRYESGGFTTDEYFNQLGAMFGNRFGIDRLKKAFGSVLPEPIPGMEDLVRRAAQKTPSVVVSNTNEYHFSDVLPRTPALKYLPKRYLSYQIGAIKPSKRFFEHVIRNETVPPGEMLFIDDVLRNVEAAEKAGMVGYQFRNVAELEKMLKKLEVL